MSRALQAPSPRDEAQPYVSRARFLMGTPLSIEAGGLRVEEAIEAAFDEVERLDQVLSNWHDSELVRLNDRAARSPVDCSEDLFAAVTAALHWAKATDGAFDPTVEPFVRRLGLRGDEGHLPGGAPANPPILGEGGVQVLHDGPGTFPEQAPVGWRHVRLDREARTVAFDAPGVGIDLGGIGKGFALDAATRVLRSHGVQSALLNFGGQVLAFGPGPDEGGWRVGLTDPADRDRSVEVVILRDASLATSGQGERARVTARGRVGHILDPRSGAPAPFEGTVSVLAADATAADALDTALFVMGPERGVRWASVHQRDAVFLVRDEWGRLVRSGTGSLLHPDAAQTSVVPAATRSLLGAVGKSVSAAPASEGAAVPQEEAAGDLERRLAALEAQATALQAELERLRGGGAVISAAELEQRIEALSREIERLRVGAAAAPEASGALHGFGPAASKVYHARRGVSIGGYGEALYVDPSARLDDGSLSGESASADLLRAVLYFGYKFDDRFLFNSEIEYEHAVAGEGAVGEVAVEFAYVDYKAGPRLGARGGLLLIPMGFINELHEPPIFFGAQRPEVERFIIPATWREIGLGVYGDAGPVSWKTYLVAGLDAAGFTGAAGIRGGRQGGSESIAEDFALTARIDWVPRPGLLLGLSGFTGDAAQGAAGVGGARLTQWDAHAEWNWKGLHARGLFVRTHLEDAAEVGVLTGEAVGSQLNGYYGEVAWNALAAARATQQEISPFFRYEAYDTQAEMAPGTPADPGNDRLVRAWGVRYRPIPNVAIKADYLDRGDSADTAVDGFQLALGWLF